MSKPAAAALLLLAAGLAYAYQGAATPAEPADTEGTGDDWLASLFGGDSGAGAASPVIGGLGDLLGLGATVIPAGNDANRAAFLAMIRQSEGTAGANGYRTYYGGSLFDSFADHPNVKHRVFGITSTAAGAYQFLYSTWKECQRALSLPDFSPASQDQAALYLLKRSGALAAIDAGQFTRAVQLAAPTWASLPGAGYGQHENPLASLQAAYQSAGGTVA